MRVTTKQVSSHTTVRTVECDYGVLITVWCHSERVTYLVPTYCMSSREARILTRAKEGAFQGGEP